MITLSPRNKKIGLLIAVILLLGAVAGYGYIEHSWFRNAGEVVAEPRMPKKPKDVADEVKVLYSEAVAMHEARIADPVYVKFLEEGLAWKSVGEFTTGDARREYLTYAAFVYSKAGENFSDQWVPFYNAGNVFVMMNEFGRAEQAFKKAAEIAPDRGEVLIAIVEMLQAAKGSPTPELVEYMAARLPGLQVDGGQFVLIYTKFLLEAGFNKEALAILRVGAETFSSDTRVAKEYATVKVELEKRGYKEEVELN